MFVQSRKVNVCGAGTEKQAFSGANFTTLHPLTVYYIQPTLGVAKLWSTGQIQPDVFVLIKFYWDTAIPIHLNTVYSRSKATTAKLNRYDRDFMF